MRRRTQAELDQLVAHAGFRKIEQWTDDWGIFTRLPRSARGCRRLSAGEQSQAAADVPSLRPAGRAFAWLALPRSFFLRDVWLRQLARRPRRANVPAIVFDWEAHIPFSHGRSFRTGRSTRCTRSRSSCARRSGSSTRTRSGFSAAQLVCVTIFILFPLRFSFERPETRGLFGAMFDVLMGFDKPFNQMPSLHVALLVMHLAAFPAPRTSPLARARAWMGRAHRRVRAHHLSAPFHRPCDGPVGRLAVRVAIARGPAFRGIRRCCPRERPATAPRGLVWRGCGRARCGCACCRRLGALVVVGERIACHRLGHLRISRRARFSERRGRPPEHGGAVVARAVPRRRMGKLSLVDARSADCRSGGVRPSSWARAFSRRRRRIRCNHRHLR